MHVVNRKKTVSTVTQSTYSRAMHSCSTLYLLLMSPCHPHFSLQVTLKQTWLLRDSMSSKPTMSSQRWSRTSCSIFTKQSLIWSTRRFMSCSQTVCPARALSKRSMRSRMFMKTGRHHSLGITHLSIFVRLTSLTTINCCLCWNSYLSRFACHQLE